MMTEISLTAKKNSWEWFFDTIFNCKKSIERKDGKSLGNFWAIVQHLQQQFIENNKDVKELAPNDDMKWAHDAMKFIAGDTPEREEK